MPEECPECLNPCEMHGLTYCSVCHKHSGQCDFGDCGKKSDVLFDYKRTNGDIYEVRGFCFFHAIEPRYGWLRKGATKRETDNQRTQ